MTTDIPPTDIRIRELLAPSIETRGDMRELVMVPLGAIVLALIIGALIMIATSVPPATILQSFVALADGALGSVNAVSETLTAAIPLVLAGLGIGLAFRAGLFNIGAEGQMVVGGLATAVASFSITGVPMVIHLPLALLIGLSVGALYAGIAGVLRSNRGAWGDLNDHAQPDFLSTSGLFPAPALHPERRQVRSNIACRSGKCRTTAPSLLHRSQYAPSFWPVHHAGRRGSCLVAFVSLETWVCFSYLRRKS